jgi:hypothetical protein
MLKGFYFYGDGMYHELIILYASYEKACMLLFFYVLIAGVRIYSTENVAPRACFHGPGLFITV